MPSLGPKDQLTGLTKISGDPTSLEGTYKMEVLKYEDMNELEKKMQDLRNLRNEYSKKIDDIQNQIDELDFKNKNLTQFIHQYVIVDSSPNNDRTYMYVDHIGRLVIGAHLVGSGFQETLIKSYSDFTIRSGNSFSVYVDGSEDVQIISKEEYEKALEDKINQYRKYITR